MAESAALLVDEVFPEQPVRQCVLSVPFPLRFLFASRPEVMGRVLGIVYRCIATRLIKKAGFSCKMAEAGAVTLIQRFGSALTKSPGAILNGRRLAPKGWRAGCPESPQRPLCCAWTHECRGRMDAQERPTCCSSTGCISSALTASCGSAG
jgi:hypothetical protein